MMDYLIHKTQINQCYSCESSVCCVKLESFPSELIQCYLIKMPDLRGNIDVLKSSNSQEYF